MPVIETAEDVTEKGHADDARDLRAWLDEIGSKQQLMLKVVRKQPQKFNGLTIEGHLGTFHDFIDEDFIRERWGGGTYVIYVHKRDSKGRMPFATARTVKIGGIPPKIDGEELLGGGPSNGNNGDSGSAINALQWMTKQALDDKRSAEREQRNAPASGMDPMLLSSMMDPLRDQLREMSSRLEAKDSQIMNLISGPKGETFQDKMLDKMLDGESARIITLRDNHDSEVRQLRSRHEAEIDRERDHYKEELKAQERRHEREIDMLKMSQGAMAEGSKLAYENRIDTLKSETKRLQDDATALKVEVAELRAQKVKTLPEQASEIVAMQESLSALGIGGKKGDEDDDKGKSMVERLVGRVFDNPEAIGDMIGAVRGKGSMEEQQQAAAAEQQQQMMAAQQQQLAARRANAIKKKRRAVAPPQQAQGTDQEPMPSSQAAPPALPKLNPIEVEMAVTYIENAVANGKTTPEDVASTARLAIPGDILTYIEKVGVDAFLSKSADLRKDSILRTQKGRTFIREVARLLLGSQ